MFFTYILSLLRNLFFTGYIEYKNVYPKPLPKEKEEEYIKKAISGDIEAKNLLITHNMRLVIHIAKKYSSFKDYEDLISAGNIGLIKSISSYSPDRGTTLGTFAARCIENEILMMLRSAKKTKPSLSLSDPIGQDKEGNEITIGETIIDQGIEVFDQVYNKLQKENVIIFLKNCLDDREFEIIKKRFDLDNEGVKTQKEIAQSLDISRSYVSRIEKKVLKKLKSKISDEKSLK